MTERNKLGKHPLPAPSRSAQKRQRLTTDGDADPRGTPSPTFRQTSSKQQPGSTSTTRFNAQQPQQPLLPSNIRQQAAHTSQLASVRLTRQNADPRQPTVSVQSKGPVASNKTPPHDKKKVAKPTPLESKPGGLSRSPPPPEKSSRRSYSHAPSLQFNPTSTPVSNGGPPLRTVGGGPPNAPVQKDITLDAQPFAPRQFSHNPKSLPSSTTASPAAFLDNQSSPTKQQKALIRSVPQQEPQKQQQMGRDNATTPTSSSLEVDFDESMWELMEEYEENQKQGGAPTISPTPPSLLSPPAVSSAIPQYEAEKADHLLFAHDDDEVDHRAAPQSPPGRLDPIDNDLGISHPPHEVDNREEKITQENNHLDARRIDTMLKAPAPKDSGRRLESEKEVGPGLKEDERWMLLAVEQDLYRRVDPFQRVHDNWALQRALQQAHAELFALLFTSSRSEYCEGPMPISVAPEVAQGMPPDRMSPELLRNLSTSLLRALSSLSCGESGVVVLQVLRDFILQLSLPEGWNSSEKRNVTSAVLRLLHTLLKKNKHISTAPARPKSTRILNRSFAPWNTQEKQPEQLVSQKEIQGEQRNLLLTRLMNGLRMDAVQRDATLPTHILSVLGVVARESPVDGLLQFAPLIECGTLRQMLRKESTIGVKEKVLDVLSFLVLNEALLNSIRRVIDGNPLERVVGLLSATDHGTPNEMRSLRQKAVRLVSCIISRHPSTTEGGSPLIDDARLGNALSTKLVSGLVLLINEELQGLESARAIDTPRLQLIREALHLLWVYTRQLRDDDVRQHVHPVRHLFVALSSRLLDRSVPPALWDLADVVLYLQAFLLE